MQANIPPRRPADIPSWRPAEAADLTAIDRISDVVHPTMVERPAVLAEKFYLFPRGCRVLVRDGVIVGYGIAHPWHRRAVPPLDRFLGQLPPDPDCLFIHDVAILPSARGFASAGAFVAHVAALAERMGIDTLALVSVYGTDPHWARYGFVVRDTPELADKLSGYADHALYMARPAETP